MKFFTSLTDAILRDDPPGGPGGAIPPATPPVAPPAADAPPVPPPVAGVPGDGAPPVSPPGTPAAAYKPEGIADHLLGATDQETIDKLLKSVNGFRKDMGDVPEKAEAYKDFGEIDPAIKPFMDTLTNDKLFDRMTEYAKAEGIPLAKFQGLTRQMMTVGAELGLFEPPIDTAAERTALTPDVAKHLPEPEQKAARERRMNDNYAWLDSQVAQAGQPGLSREAVDFAKSMLGDRAVGHQFIEHFRAQNAGGKGPLLGGQPGAVADPKAEIARRQTLPENTWGDPKFSQASYDQLQKDGRAVHGG